MPVCLMISILFKGRGTRLKLAVLLIFVAFSSQLFSAQESQFEDSAFLVSIGETQEDLAGYSTSFRECLVVLPDGRFHMERRTQRLSESRASLEIFESTLDQKQLQKLQEILKDESIRKLPSYLQPVYPMTVPWFATFTAEILRGSEIQTVGYWVWHGGNPELSPNSTPEATKKVWQDSATVLRPLLQWFHALKSSKLEPSPDAKSTLCKIRDSNGNGL